MTRAPPPNRHAAARGTAAGRRSRSTTAARREAVVAAVLNRHRADRGFFGRAFMAACDRLPDGAGWVEADPGPAVF